MRYFLTPIILGLVFVSGLNIYIDPANRWRTQSFAFETNWHENECWVGPVRIEERRLRSKQIPLLSKIELLGIGSSRIMNVDTEMLSLKNGFYNASVSGASVWDYIAQWQQFKESKNIPKRMMIYVDTWVFNKNTWHKYRWTPNYKSVLNFLLDFVNDYQVPYEREPVKNIKLIISATYNWLTGTFLEFVDLFSPAVLKVSIQELRIALHGENIKSNYISNIENRPAQYPSWRADGSKLYPFAEDIPKTIEEISEIGRNIAVGGMYVYMMNWETDHTAIELMDLLLADAKANGVEVLLVHPPFQHSAYEIMLKRPEYKDIRQYFDNSILPLVKKYNNVGYCDVLNPSIAG
ncbi:MAG: hypothetical protein ABL927_12980, partial [Bdellovibrionales bacterium]